MYKTYIDLTREYLDSCKMKEIKLVGIVGGETKISPVIVLHLGASDDGHRKVNGAIAMRADSPCKGACQFVFTDSGLRNNLYFPIVTLDAADVDVPGMLMIFGFILHTEFDIIQYVIDRFDDITDISNIEDA